MCLSPITILNRRKDFRPGYDPTMITVPCGHCWQCQQRKRADWFVRLRYEWKHYTQELNGLVLFPTLTYNDEFLPMLEIQDNEVSQHFNVVPGYYPSFDKKTFQNFLKKFRAEYSRLFEGSDFKYFSVCEYGGHTHRPHYHSIMFFPDQLHVDWYKMLLEVAWSVSVKKSDVPDWFVEGCEHHFSLECYSLQNQLTDPSIRYYVPYGTGDVGKYLAVRDINGRIRYHKKRGFVSWSKKHGAVVHNGKALSYVTKYIFKDQDYFSDESINNMYNLVNRKQATDYIKQDSDTAVINSYEQFFSDIKNMFPFVLSSTDLGGSLVRKIESDIQFEDTNDPEHISEETLASPGKVLPIDGRYYTIPAYILDRVFRSNNEIVYNNYNDHRGDSVRPPLQIELVRTHKKFLTSIGEECLRLRYRLAVKYQVNELEKLFNLRYDRLFLDLIPDCDDKQRLLMCLNQLPDNVDLELFVNYKLRWQHVSLYPFESMFRRFSREDWIYNARMFTDYIVYHNNDIHKDRDFFDLQNSQYIYPVINSLPIFHGYDYLDYSINQLRCLIGRFSRDPEKDESKKLRDYLNSLNYV